MVYRSNCNCFVYELSTWNSWLSIWYCQYRIDDEHRDHFAVRGSSDQASRPFNHLDYLRLGTDGPDQNQQKLESSDRTVTSKKFKPCNGPEPILFLKFRAKRSPELVVLGSLLQSRDLLFDLADKTHPEDHFRHEWAAAWQDAMIEIENAK